MRWLALALTIGACSETTAAPDGGSLSDGAPPECGTGGRAYYVDSFGGDDGRSGTSSAQAWQTLAKLSSVTFQPGDTICLARGGQFTGTLTLHGNGTAMDRITIDAYCAGYAPIIIGNDTEMDRYQHAAVNLVDLSYWTIQHIEVQAPATNGMRIFGGNDITVRDCDFTNVMYVPPGAPDIGDYDKQGMALVVARGTQAPANITIDHCNFIRVSKGAWIESGDHVILENSYFYDVQGVAALFAGNVTPYLVTNSRIRHNVFDFTDTTGTGWNPVMLGGAENCYEEFNEIKNTPS